MSVFDEGPIVTVTEVRLNTTAIYALVEGAMRIVHEPCGECLLTTETVHLDTIARLVNEHRCSR